MYKAPQEVNIPESVENKDDVGKVVARQAQTCYVDDQIAHQSDCQGEDAYSEDLEIVMGELRRQWVDLPDPSMFSDHRSLAKYSREIKVMELILQDLAHSKAENHPMVVEAAYNYILHAHSVYLSAVHKWIEEANAKREWNVSVPALPRVQRLLSLHDSSINDTLHRYYERAKLKPSERRERTRRSTVSRSSSSLSAESQEILGNIEREYRVKMSELSDQLVDAATSAEVAKEERRGLVNRISRMTQEKESDKEERERLLKMQKAAVKEKGELVKDKNHLERELAKYKELATEAMFPDAAICQRQKLVLSDDNRVKNVSSYEDELPSTSHQSQQTQIGLEARVTQKEDHAKWTKSFPLDIASQLPSENGTLRQRLRSEADEFVPRSSVKSRDPLAERGDMIGSSNTFTKHKVCFDDVRPKTLNEFETSRQRELYPTGTSESFSKTTFRHPWQARKQEANNNPVEPAYGVGQLNSRMNSIYFPMWSVGQRDFTRQFGGKRSDYPMFRQQLLRDYEMLWNTDPYALLQRIVNTVTDSVYEHIKSAWIMRDPQEALDRVWEIFEDLYGDPKGLLDSVIRDIKWDKECLVGKVPLLQSYCTKLRNLKSIAESVGMSNELSRPKLIFRIVDCFSPALYAQFAHEYKEMTAWRFETVLMFLDDVIANLQFKDRHTYDISTFIGEENSSSSNKKLSIRRKTSAYRLNNLQGQKLSTAVSQLSAQHSPGKTMSVDKQNKCQSSTTFQTSNLCRIHPLARHKTIDGYEFLKIDVKERRIFVKAHGLCFYCLGKHLAKYCSEKQSCPICQGGHSELLHQQKLPNNKFGEPQPQRNGDKRNQRLVVDQDVMDGNLNAARPVKDDGAIEQQFETSVPIMALTAVIERQKDIKEIAFYALVDTGADVSICTKDLAEKMFRWSPEDSISISFLNEKAKRYQCMKKTLQLKYGENDTVNIPDVGFIDMKLPYSQCVPDKWQAKEHGYSVDHCHAAHEKRSVDMILGAKDLRKFQVLEKCRWNNAAACEYLIAAHPLGTIFWGLRIKKGIPQCICATHQNVRDNYAKKVLNIISAEQNITNKEGLHDMLLLVHDILRYYRDQLVLEPDCEEFCLSREDERVLSFYKKFNGSDR